MLGDLKWTGGAFVVMISNEAPPTIEIHAFIVFVEMLDYVFIGTWMFSLIKNKGQGIKYNQIL